MNVLSLRINSLKTDDNFKKADEDLLKLEVEDFWSEEIKLLLKAINNAASTESQLREVKRFANLISSSMTREFNQQIASKLIAIYFKEKVKHPAKSTIQSCLNQSSEQALIVECIEAEVKRKVAAIDIKSSGDYVHFISCLNEASQNFRPAIKAVGRQVETVVGLINSLIVVYENLLNTKLSPAQKNEISHQLHCSLQAAIYCVKNYINDYNDHSVVLRKNLDLIAVDCIGLMEHKDLPMDAKNNCAMLIVLHSILTADREYIGWIRNEKCCVERRLCLIFGHLSTLTSTNADFEILADISRILKEVFLESPVDPAIVQSVCRSLMQMSKKIATMDITQNSIHLEAIFTTSLSVVFLNLEHHMDSTRYMMKETLKSLAEISIKLVDANFLTDRLFDEINRLVNVNLKSIVVLTISPTISAKQVLQRLPQFLDTLYDAVSENKVTNHNLMNCYEALANSSYLELTFDTWFENFVPQALRRMKCYQAQSEQRLVIENLIVRLIKKDKRVLDEILKHQNDYDVGFILLCLSTGKKIGLFEKEASTDELWKGIISFTEIRKAMVNADENVRTSALMLIIETRKTVEGFTQQDLDCIMYFLSYNINVQNPSSRQSILGLIKNMFVRLQSVLQSLIKKKDQEAVEFYQRFLVQFQEFCLDNLFEGANLSRRMISLRILFYIVEAFKVRLEQKSSHIWTKDKFTVLMNVLNDSFEANKEMVMEIMKLIPKEAVRKYSSISLEQLESMMKSIKPPLSLTASYFIEIVAMLTLKAGDFVFDFEITSTVSQESLWMLNWMLNHLLQGVRTAEKSLIVASMTNPLYGFILSIRHLLSKLDLQTLGECQKWRDFFARLIILCKRLTEVVAQVVNNSSPEGILPNEEVQDLDEITREEWTKIGEQVTPQIILLCSWRTIKEVSLLLGDICLRAPLMNGNVGLLDVDQIMNIGDHFLNLLSKTKHRGAFEQCFFGFSQLCLRLWTCNELKLHKLPSEMLQQMIHSISGVEKENNELLSMKNLCATRRSAGLPFMIQALITSELKVSTNKNFHFVMKNLIQFCRQGEFLETRTHSLNILRALYRCTSLNDAIGEYIVDGMKCAILGLEAESWLERNSSTLLFSSLMVRIFGVQRTKDGDELSIRNKMSGRLFFLRYPELYDFFMEQLQEAAVYVSNDQMNAKLYPILLLLIRLFPSSTEGSEAKLELSGFIPIVSLSTGCVEMQARVLCAKFIASVLPPTLSMSRTIQSIAILNETRNCPANISHGILLQILFMIRAFPDTLHHSNVLDMIRIIKELGRIRAQFRSQLVCYGTFLDIIIEIHEKVWEHRESYKVEMLQCLDSCTDFDDSAPFGVPIITKKIFLLKLMKFSINEGSQLIDDVDSTKVFGEGFFAALNTFLMMVDIEYAMSMKDEYDMDSKEIFFFMSLPQQRRDRLSQALKQDSNKKNIFQQLIRSHDYQTTVKSFDMLSLMTYERGDIEKENNFCQRFIRMAMSKPEQLKKSMLKYINKCVEGEELFSQLDFKFLVQLSTDSSFVVKSSATDFVASIASNYRAITSRDTFLYFAKSVLLLLMDDEDEIRQRNTKIVMMLVHADRQDVVPTYAQECFIDFLIQPLNFVHFSKHDLMALISIIVVDEENSLNENIVEYRVFDKNEVNIFGETFILKRHCTLLLKQKLQEVDSSLLKNETEKIFRACQKFTDGRNNTDIEKFLLNI